MPNRLGALALTFMIAMVLTRVVLLRRQGVQAMRFGQIDKTDFFIPPFALFYFYIVFAAAFGWLLWLAQTSIILLAGLASFALLPWHNKRRAAASA